ncbi:MAG: pyridoxal-phosphate dependent enzyme [Muribaculaceae bacterium]|nr:pyridoxal-phosphate dependent enzyme [Muribaculaceae bacterium]
MRFVSTRTPHAPSVSFLEAVRDCLPSDGGVYMPVDIPRLPSAFFGNMSLMSFRELGYIIMTTLLGNEFEHSFIKNIVDSAFTFPVPLHVLDSRNMVAELFHGPTLSCKDISSAFMASFLKKIRAVRPSSRPLVILMASTGSTGAAMASAFAGFKDTHLIITYPRGVLNTLERAQIASLGPSVHAIEVAADIDGCKDLVRHLLEDEDLKDSFILTSANSLNVARILPQIPIFFNIAARLTERDMDYTKTTVSIPAGNFGLATAAVMARRMGLRFNNLIAVRAAHDNSQSYARAITQKKPSGLNRLNLLASPDIELPEVFITNRMIADTINSTMDRYAYLPDPHTAAALHAGAGAPLLVALGTAHPARSLDAMTAITGRPVELPLQFHPFVGARSLPVRLAPTVPALKRYITQHIK